MARKRGRPCLDEQEDTRSCIVEAASKIIAEEGIEKLNVRAICRQAGVSAGTFYHHFSSIDYLLMDFIRDIPFETLSLNEPEDQVARRQTELYLHLSDRYLGYGEAFLHSFYTTSNKAISAYLNQTDGRFQPETVMNRSEKELYQAKQDGYLPADMDIHAVAQDLCTIFKGAIFEWCLAAEKFSLPDLICRLFSGYLSGIGSVQSADRSQ